MWLIGLTGEEGTERGELGLEKGGEVCKGYSSDMESSSGIKEDGERVCRMG